MKALKLILVLVKLFILTTAFGQSQRVKLPGIWVSPLQEVIIIDKSKSGQPSGVLSSPTKFEHIWNLNITEDSLHFFSKRYDIDDKWITNKYDLRILNVTDSFLLVSPASDSSKTFFDERSQIKFVRQQYKIDTTIKFKELIFHTGPCLGACPVYHLQITNQRRIRLFGEIVFKNGFQQDTAREGYFTGYLTDSAYRSILKAIQTCDITNLIDNGITGVDASEVTIILYYNNQRKRYVSMYPPLVLNNLIGLLYNICRETPVKRTNEIFKFED